MISPRPLILLLITATVLLTGMLTAVPVTHAQNPFTSAPGPRHTAPPPPVKSKLMVTLITWQQQLRQKMADLVREAKTKKRISPLLVLAFSAFLYGVIHSAGPGHGKAVALSYILSCRPGIKKGLLFGNILALTHGGAGIVLVLAAFFIFNTAISSSLDTVTRLTQTISFSLITALGLFILGRAIFTWVRPEREAIPSRLYSNPLLTAFFIGMVPCPGVVMIMIFSISMGMTWLGVVLGGIVAFGMAATITLTILTGMSGRAALMSAASRKQGVLVHAEHLVEAVSGTLVAALGALLLGTVL